MSDWFTIAEAAEYAKVDVSTIDRWCKEGKLACEQAPDGDRRVMKEDLDALVSTSPVRAQVIIRGLTRADEEKLLSAIQHLEPTRGWELKRHEPLVITVERPRVFAAGAEGPPKAANELRMRNEVVDAAVGVGIQLGLDGVEVSLKLNPRP